LSTTPKQDSRSVSELFAAATDWTIDNGDGDWTAVLALHLLGSREVLDRALELTRSDDPRTRGCGLDILGQLGVPNRTFPEECLSAAIRLLNSDPNPGVLHAAADAFGHLGDPRGIDALARRVDHDNAGVRYAVAVALGRRDEPKAVAALIHLTDDPDANVRDWATFGLGGQRTPDTAEIREALYRRLDDVDEETRFEAMRGLARLGDLRVAQPLIDALEANPQNLDLWDPASTLLKLDDEHDELSADALVERIQSLIGKKPA
jgi:HEAT repeat protein